MIRRFILSILMMTICVAAWGQDLSLSEVLKRANAGDAEAQLALGNAYYEGSVGLQQSYTEAMKWYLKAAEQGNSGAIYNIFLLYLRGHGVEKDPVEEFKWALKAAEKGFKNAQYNVGLCYEKGEVVQQSYTEAAKWYKKSADQGFAGALNNLGNLYNEGKGVTKSIEEAEKLYLKAADLGEVAAMYNLGLLYKENVGYLAAEPWFEKAANEGLASAQYELGLSYFMNYDSVRMTESALSWLHKAADQDDFAARLLIPTVERSLERVKAEEAAAAVTKATKAKPAAPSPSASGSASTPSRNTHRRSFNTPYWDERPWGLSVGYVQKYWSYKPRPEYLADYGDVEERCGAFSDEGEATFVNGLQLGLRYEPQFGAGFGLNTGLFYEFYTDHSMDYIDDYGDDFKSIWEEHSLNIPMHLEFRANFGEGFQLFAYGGASVDFGLSSTYRSYYYDDEWTSDRISGYGREYEALRYNASWEAGAGVRFNGIQIQWQMSHGLIDMAEHGAEHTVFQHKPLTLSLSWMF